ncbi:MAG: phage holin family protein [Erysipelotrichaceae bacterium]|nr:phage holin family protein [Erysipelotrichaceae bacterium]
MNKEVIFTGIGIIGAAIAHLYGGWTSGMTTLVILMIIDYITGLLVAAVFGKSKKTEDGKLESRAGWKGLVRKCVTLLMVLVATRVDLLIGTNFVRDASVIGFSANELLSIVENAGLMGIPMPSAMKNAIEVLQKKADGVDQK